MIRSLTQPKVYEKMNTSMSCTLESFHCNYELNNCNSIENTIVLDARFNEDYKIVPTPTPQKRKHIEDSESGFKLKL